MSEDVRSLIEDLATAEQDGVPAVILVDDYRERADLAAELSEEASLFGIDLVLVISVEEASERLPSLDARRDKAVLILIDAGNATSFGQWLNANREALPAWARFVLVLMLRQDFPMLAKEAPAFMSWAKALTIPHLADVEPIPAAEIAEELRRLEQTTGLSPQAFIDAWERGELPDTYQNAAWLNLACAVSGRGAR